MDKNLNSPAIEEMQDISSHSKIEYTPADMKHASPQKTAPEGGKGLGTASLVLSLCSFIPCCIPYIGGTISFICGVLGIVFACVSRSQNGGRFSTVAKAGLIISIIYFALSVLSIIAVIVFYVLYIIFGFSVAGLGILSSSNY